MVANTVTAKKRDSGSNGNKNSNGINWALAIIRGDREVSNLEYRAPAQKNLQKILNSNLF